jgi:hypothetical protein
MLLGGSISLAQEDVDSITGDKIKKGWTWGGVPAVSYDADMGFQYGAALNFYYFGDEGIRYPEYDHSLYLEWSRFTKGSGINRFQYDAMNLLPGIRFTFEVAYLTEQALDFYGFNGYESRYEAKYEDDGDPEYITRMFYRHERKLLRIFADFQGQIIKDRLLWYGGIAFNNYKMGTVDIDRLNKNKPDDKILPDTITLYDIYVDKGLLEGDAGGGNANYLSGGIVWDTRDNEPNPMKGIWTEAIFRWAPSFLGNGDYGHLKFALTHRQYFTIIPRDLSFAYRLSYQTTVSGNPPFYAQPLLAYTFYRGMLAEGLGGAKSLRGVMRNRVVGNSLLFGNFEIRWKAIRTTLFKTNNLYIGINAFFDTGRTLGSYDLDLSDLTPEERELLFDADKDKFHSSAGAGVRFALNQNFIISADYGIPFDKRDGSGGLYIGLNYLF